MNLFFRLLKLLIGFAITRPGCGVLDEATMRLRVWITDHDQFGHMNNSRYISLMDLGMIDLFLKAGMVGDMRRARISPLIAGKRIAFYRPLSFPTRYEVRTRIVCWNTYHVLFQHDFVSGGKLCSRGHSIGRLIGAKGDRPTIDEVIVRTGWDVPAQSPQPTPYEQDILDRAEHDRVERGSAWQPHAAPAPAH